MSTENQKPPTEARDFRFPKSGVDVGFTDELDSILQEFVRKHQIAVEQLTDKQMAAAIRQAIECGDFTRQVCVTDNAQNIIYIPYARQQELKSKLRELENLVTSYMVAPEGSEHCKDCFDNLKAWWDERNGRPKMDGNSS